MNKEIGIIKDISNNEVSIEFIRSSACGNCGACMVSKDTSKMLIKLPYKAKAEIGDSVYIDVEKNFYILSSILLYVMPLIILMASVIIGVNFLKGEYGQVLTAAISIALSFGSYFALKIFSKKFKNMKTDKMTYYKYNVED